MNSGAKAVLALAWMLGAVLVHASDSKQQQAERIFDRAYRLTNLEAKGSPALVMKPTITVHAVDARRDDGTYDLTWESPAESRREISFPDYHEVTVNHASKVWHSSTVLYRP